MGDYEGLLNSTDVRDAMFSRPRAGRRGYRAEDVDELLDRVVARLEGRGDLTVADVRNAQFRKPPLGQRGYREDEVDRLLARIARTLESIGPARRLPGPPPAPVASTALITAAEVRESAFHKPPMGQRGYNEDQVDAFLDTVVARLEGRGGLTAADVHAVRFGKPRIGWRGYNEDDVDALLDRIAQTLQATQR